MKKKNSKKSHKHHQTHHHPLITRRDFLSSGLLTFGAMTTLPMTAWANRGAHFFADRIKVGGMPFMAFDMAGGASLHGNFLVGKSGGPEDLLSSYSTLGWDPRKTGSLNKDFGLPMSAQYSKILSGILQTASAAARANFRMGSFCHNVASFDTSTNNLNSTILVLKSGARGMFINNGTGSMSSGSGGNSQAVQQSLPFKPVFVGGVDDILSSVSFGGPGTAGMGVDQLKIMAQAGIDLGAVQAKMYSGKPGGYPLAAATPLAYGQTLKFLTGVEGLDPRLDTDCQNIYQINAQTAVNNSDAISACLVKNTVQGNSGPTTWTLGDCDYHDGSSTKGDTRDLQMGQQIGRAVEYAFRAKKPLFFQLITDGSCTAQGGDRNWGADSIVNMTIIGYYNPTAAPKYIMDGNQPRYQVGSFTDAQAPDVKSVVGSSSDLVAYAVFANYLHVNGRLSEFNNFAPGVFTSADLEKVLIFDSGT